MKTSAISRDQALSLLQFAVLAPSSHNTQPWHFHLSAGTIDLYADRTRALAVNDPEDRELTISCGCALMNLRAVAAARSIAAAVDFMPEPDEPDLLARVRLAPSAAPAPEADLCEFIDRRRTWRMRFASRPVAQSAVAELAAAADAEGDLPPGPRRSIDAVVD